MHGQKTMKKMKRPRVVARMATAILRLVFSSRAACSREGWPVGFGGAATAVPRSGLAGVAVAKLMVMTLSVLCLDEG